ncbi:MAG: hypothetical protein MUO62_14885, partial [Anaerolineales bacterium]|nr:hypothetical protein [Anaerolineales bacterium]
MLFFLLAIFIIPLWVRNGTGLTTYLGLLSAGIAIADDYLLFYKHMTPTVYSRGSDHGVKMTIRYLCEPRQRRGSAQAIWEDVLRAFSKHSDIT